MTIDRAATQASPTGSSPVLFTVTFTEPVTGFDGPVQRRLGEQSARVAIAGGEVGLTAEQSERCPRSARDPFEATITDLCSSAAATSPPCPATSEGS